MTGKNNAEAASSRPLVTIHKGHGFSLLLAVLFSIGAIVVFAFPLGPVPNPGHPGGQIQNGSISGFALADNLTINDTFVRFVNRSGSNIVAFNLSNGNVGIGTASPTHKLEIIDADAGTFTDAAGDALAIEGTSVANIDLRTSTTGEAGILWSDTAARARGLISYTHVSDALFFRTAATERMRIDSSGNVGIGSTNPGSKLVVKGGDVFIPGSGGLVLEDTGANNCRRLRVVGGALSLSGGFACPSS
jgi:hypothetical protein